MACKRHIHRKRPNTCKDCAAELNKKVEQPKPSAKMPNKETVKAMKEADELIKARKEKKKPEPAPVEKTSREMLADLNAMEKETDDMVIKPERQKKEKPVNNTAVPKTEVPEETKSLVEVNNEAIDNYFSEKLKLFKEQLAGMANVQYEHLDIPMDKINVATMDKLYRDRWHLVNFLTGQCAKASGFSSDVAVFDRIKGTSDKTVAEWKKEIK